MRATGAIVLAICLNWLSCQAALAEKRVALVIGNSAYQGVSKLANPANDAAAIATMIRNAGFDLVEFKQNLKINEMRRQLRDFSDRVRDADIVIAYFAGHGIEIDGVNYLIPVDAVLERDIDAHDEAVSLDRILTVIEPARKLRLVILDACRDNPFSRVMRRTNASRAIDRGLAKVEPTSPNTLVAFAARAGSTALDGDSGNSPFTEALVRYLPKPGLDVRKAFGFVRDEVLRVTNNKQEPFIYGSLGGEDVSLVPLPRTPAPDADARVRRDYELAERVGTREAWDLFLSTYPDGFYAKLAIAQRNKLAAEEARLQAAEKAGRAAEEQQRLTHEGARAVEQKKAAELARAAEDARVAAEKRKAIEDARLVEAERVRAAAQARAEAVAKAAAESAKKLEEARQAAKAEQERTASEKEAKAADAARAKAAAEAKPVETKAAEAAKADKPVGQLASLSPPDAPRDAKSDKPSQAELPRLLQAELKRVGCVTGAAGDEWNSAAQKALGLFNKNAKKKFDVKVASLDALDSARSRSGRVCPLVCDRGYRADGDKCTKIICRAGYELGRDDACERIGQRKSTKPAVYQGEPPAETRNVQRTERPSATNREALYAQCRAKLDAEVPLVFRQRYTIRPDFKKLEHCVASAGR
ncbi:MAG: caspase family protein [Bradyrhizobium sp.]|nr:caspase family protein [Bradyrhizobium sp.]